MGERTARVEQDARLSAYSLRPWIGLARRAVGGLPVDICSVIVGARQANVALLAPATAPRIANNPIVGGVAIRNDNVVNVTRPAEEAFLATVAEDATAIDLPRHCSDVHCDRADSGQCGLQCVRRIDGVLHVAVEGDRRLVRRARRVVGRVRQVRLKGHARGLGVVVRELGDGAFAATSASAVIRVGRTVNERLRREGEKLFIVYGVVRFDDFGGRKGPA